MDQQNKSGSDEMILVAALILICIIIYLIWTFARELVVWFFFGPDLVQLYLIGLISGFNEAGSQLFEYTKSMFDGRNDPSQTEWHDITLVSSMVGGSTHLIISGIILIMSVLVIMYMKGEGFARRFTLVGGKGKGPSLAHYQAKEWGAVVTSAHFDPNICTPEDLPAQTPLEWMRDNKVSLTEQDGMDRAAAESVFEAQLGEKWEGLDKAPIHVQAMIILCIINAKRAKEKEDIKSEIARIWTLHPKEAKKMTSKVIAPYKKDKKIRQVIDKYMSKHAFITTGLYRLLIWSRKTGGIFACAEFRWLKPIDRNLWYVLQNAGRRSYLIEGAGSVAHYQVEFLSSKPLATPKVTSAVDGLESFLEIHHVTNLEKVFHVEKDF